MKEPKGLNELVALFPNATIEATKDKRKKKEHKGKNNTGKISKKSREYTTVEERRIELLSRLNTYTDKGTSKEREVNCIKLLKETEKDNEIKTAVLSDALNENFKTTMTEFLQAKLLQLLTLFIEINNIKTAEEIPNGQSSMQCLIGGCGMSNDEMILVKNYLQV